MSRHRLDWLTNNVLRKAEEMEGRPRSQPDDLINFRQLRSNALQAAELDIYDGDDIRSGPCCGVQLFACVCVSHVWALVRVVFLRSRLKARSGWPQTKASVRVGGAQCQQVRFMCTSSVFGCFRFKGRSFFLFLFSWLSAISLRVAALTFRVRGCE